MKYTTVLLCAILFTLIVILCGQAAAQAVTEARLLRAPAIHGDTIVFVYAGDLWVAQTGSETAARRLTSHPGFESRPKISPDGRFVAFTGSYDGTPEIYLIPIEGGEPRRLTYDSNNESVLGWTPDGKIAYASNAGNFTTLQQRLWYISTKGGMPIWTPIAEVSDASFLHGGRTMVYTRSTALNFNWRGYHGGKQGRISLYDFEKNTYSELSSGHEQKYYPMAIGRSVYYISDKNNPTLNLCLVPKCSGSGKS